MKAIQRSFLFLLLLVAGCSAQSNTLTPETSRRIQNQIRTEFNLPASVDIKLGELKPSDLKDYDLLEVTLESGQRKVNYPFYLSRDGKTLARLEKMDVSADITSRLDLTGRPVLGPASAKVTIVNFDDYQCPFCTRFHETLMKDVTRVYGDKVKIIYKDYPLVQIHPWATHAAVNANCLAEQKGEAYWEYANFLHSNQQAINGGKEGKLTLVQQKAMLDKQAVEQGAKHKVDAARLGACIKKQDATGVLTSMKEGSDLGVDSTPTAFINGERVTGAVPFEQLRPIINRALVAAGETVPAGALPEAPAPAPVKP